MSDKSMTRAFVVTLLVVLLQFPFSVEILALDCFEYSAQAFLANTLAGEYPNFRSMLVMDAGPLLALGVDGRLFVFDRSDPLNPQYQDVLDLGFYYRNMAYCGDYVFLCGAVDQGVRIVQVESGGDLSDCGLLDGDIPASDVAKDGSLLGVCLYDAWQLWDCSYPSVPQLIVTFADGSGYDSISLDGDFVAILDGLEGLRMFNITNPETPVFLGAGYEGYSYENSTFRADIVLFGDVAFVLNSHSTMYENDIGGWYYRHGYSCGILDVSEPEEMTLIRTEDLGGFTSSDDRWAAVYESNGRIMVTDGPSTEVLIMDQGRPADSPPLRLPTGPHGWALACDDEIMYIGHEGGGVDTWAVPRSMGVEVLPAPEITQPNIFTSANLSIEDIEIAEPYIASCVRAETSAGGYVYSNEWIVIYRPEIAELDTVNVSGDRITSLALADSVLYFISRSSGDVMRVDLTDPESYASPDMAIAGYFSGPLTDLGNGILAVGDMYDLLFYDMAAGRDADPIATLELRTNDLVRDDAILFASTQYGVAVIDVSDPWTPSIQGYCMSEYANKLTLIGDQRALIKNIVYGYHTPSVEWFSVMDYSNLEYPVIEATPHYPFGAVFPTLFGDYICLAGVGVHMIDASDLSHVGCLPTEHDILATVFYQDQLYCVGADTLVEIPMPCGDEVPVWLTGVRLERDDGRPLLTWGVHEAGDERFVVEAIRGDDSWSVPVVALGGGRYEARDISAASASPISTTYNLYLVTGTLRSLLASEVLEPAPLPSSLRLISLVPNPFNPRTEIVFELSRPMRLTLCVYDAAGRHVRTLAEGNHAAGVHTAAWDGRDDRGFEASSGTYFLRLNTETGSISRKAVLIR